MKSFPVYKHLLQENYVEHVGTLRCTSVRRVLAVDNFPTNGAPPHLGVHMFVGFWMQHFQTGGLGEMVRHPGHHD